VLYLYFLILKSMDMRKKTKIDIKIIIDQPMLYKMILENVVIFKNPNLKKMINGSPLYCVKSWMK